MPLVKPPSRVLVTGANGFIATWIVQYLLEDGYHVIAAVRSSEKGEAILKSYTSISDGRLEYVVVEDITKEGAFDEVAKNVQGIIHTASPVVFSTGDPQEIIQPAIKGTVGILASALKSGASLKRVIVISSLAAILSHYPQPTVFTEDNWNDQAVEEVTIKGKDAPGNVKYRASKTLAEKAAWDFMEKNKEALKGKWDLVVTNPAFVYGPLLPTIPSSSPEKSLSLSPLQMYNAVVLGKYHVGDPLAPAGSWIDVRDLAKMHVLALGASEEASGQRIIMNVGVYIWQEFLDIIHAISPPPAGFSAERISQLPKGIAGDGKDTVHPIVCDNARMLRLFGERHKPRTAGEMIRDTLEDYARRGW